MAGMGISYISMTDYVLLGAGCMLLKLVLGSYKAESLRRSLLIERLRIHLLLDLHLLTL